jgi:putative ABC transport system ATP-binding protein
MPVIEFSAVEKVYGSGGARVSALRGVSLLIPRGAMLAVMGPSGAGKTTLLELTAGLSEPDGGRVSVDGIDLSTLSIDERADLRLQKIGVVFQAFNLLPFVSAFDNVALPLRLRGLAPAEVDRRVCDAQAAAALRWRDAARRDRTGSGHRSPGRPGG